jgi:hypothetical protein
MQGTKKYSLPKPLQKRGLKVSVNVSFLILLNGKVCFGGLA